MNISVIGTGYVGLVSGVCLSEKGHRVTCVDNDKVKVDLINNKISPIHEKGLDKLLNKNFGNNLNATTNLYESVINSDVSLIAVGTPFDGELINLNYIREVSKEIGLALKDKKTYHVVIVKSTVIPGTTDDVVIPILEKYSGKKIQVDFGVGMNPEFLREGVAVEDFMNPDRIVLGGTDIKTHEIMEEIYKVFRGTDILKTSNMTAEMIKYASNSLLATMISFANEIGNFCENLEGVDIVDVMNGVHLDKRVSPILEDGRRIFPGLVSYLEAGCGFGGSCFPKDVKALISHGDQIGSTMKLLKSVIDINENQPFKILDLIHKHYTNLDGVNIAIMGLAFKPGTDDMRESPSIPIIKELLKKGANIDAYDPIAEDEAKKIFDNKDINYCNDLKESVKNAKIVIVLTSWPEFSKLNNIVEDDTLVIDGRRFLNKHDFSKYEGIGLSQAS